MSESTAVALFEGRALVAADVFQPGGVRAIIDGLRAEVAKVEVDISTRQGREACASLAFKVARSKTALDRMGQELIEAENKRINDVNAERRLIRKELDGLRDEVRRPLDEWEAAEAARVKAHQHALSELTFLATVWDDEPTPDSIDEHKARADELSKRDWQEFKKRASDAYAMVVDKLADLRTQAIERIAADERAEAERQQREERERLEAIRERQRREAQIASKAAEHARLAAESMAREEAAEAARKAEQEAHEAQARAKALLDAEIEEKWAAQAAAARAEQDRLDAIQRAKDEQERHERELAAAEKRRTDEATAAEARRVLAAEEAKRQLQKELDDKIAAEQKAADERAANLAHRRKINRAARDAIQKIVARGMDALMSESEKPVEIAQAIVEAIAKGEVPHCRISY